MSIWVGLAVLCALAAAIAYLAFRAAKSPLRPLYIPPTAWRLALDCWRNNPRVLSAMALLVVSSAALQFYFVNTSGHDPQTLLITGVVWQAFMAALTAALAVPLHLFVIHVYWRGPLVDLPARRRKLVSLLIGAAVLGLAIWMVDYLAGVAIKVLLLSTDAVVRQIEYWGLAFVSFLATSLLALVRPSLSLGLPHPLRTGIGLAAKNALALYLVLAVLAVPPAVLRLEATYLPAALIRSALPQHLVSIALISALNIFQYFAVETSTVLFASGALLQAREQASETGAIGAPDLPQPAAP